MRNCRCSRMLRCVIKSSDRIPIDPVPFLTYPIFPALLLLLAFPLLWMARPALGADDAILERTYLRDETAQRTLSEVQTLPFTPYTGLLTQGYRRNVAYWLKLKIRPGDANASPYVLRVRPNWHEDIRLFDPADPQIEPRVTGSQYPWSASELPSLNHAFLIKKTHQTRDVYIRLKTEHSAIVDVEVLEQKVFEVSDRKLELLYLFLITLLGGVSTWALINFLVRPDRVIGVFAANQISSALYCVFMVGIGRILLDDLLPDLWLDKLTTIIVFVSTFLGALFHRLLLGEYAPSRWFITPMNIFIGMTVAAMMLFALGESTPAVYLNAIAVICFSLTTFMTAWLGISSSKEIPPQLLNPWLIRFFYSAIFFIGAMGAAPLLGWLHSTEFHLHVFLLHGVVTAVIMGIFLQYRLRKISQIQFQQLSLAKLKAEQERVARMEQEQFMSMLEHELKTPLSVLKLLVANHPRQVFAENTINDISALIERCLLSDSLSHDRAISKVEFLPADILAKAIQRSSDAGRFNLSENEPHKLYSDPELYAIIVGNLLDNALKYALRGSPIRVSLRSEVRAEKTVSCISVCNQIGRAGVPDLERLFRKYYRAESALAISGTGLGLYLVKSFASMMGGDIDCVIDEEIICFRVCLPR